MSILVDDDVPYALAPSPYEARSGVQGQTLDVYVGNSVVGSVWPDQDGTVWYACDGDGELLEKTVPNPFRPGTDTTIIFNDVFEAVSVVLDAHKRDNHDAQEPA